MDALIHEKNALLKLSTTKISPQFFHERTNYVDDIPGSRTTKTFHVDYTPEEVPGASPKVLVRPPKNAPDLSLVNSDIWGARHFDKSKMLSTTRHTDPNNPQYPALKVPYIDCYCTIP